MARAPHVAGVPDIRSWALYHDVVETKKHVKEGEEMNEILQNLYVPEAIEEANRCEEEIESGPLKKHMFDTSRDKVSSMCACVLVGTVTGIMHSYPAIIPFMQDVYGITYYEAVIVVGATYGILISFGPFVSGFIGCFGIRATCGLGMFLLFCGFLLDGLVLGKAGLYISHFLLLAIGGSFACTAAMSSVVDHLRVELEVAVLILAIACPVGTIFYYCFLHFLLNYGFSYKWVHMALAIMTLVLTTLVHLLPVKEEKYHSDPFNSQKYKQLIIDCIEKENDGKEVYVAAESDEICDEDCDEDCESAHEDYDSDEDSGSDDEGDGSGGYEVEEQVQPEAFCAIDCEAETGAGDGSLGQVEDPCPAVPEESGDFMRSYVCDCSMIGDCSFMVWAIASFFVVMPFYANALFLMCYTKDYKTDTDPPPYLVVWYVIFQTVGRIGIMAMKTFNFRFTFYTFEGLLLVNILMMQLMKKAVSYGWVAFWAIFAAPVEGALLSMLPVVTLGTLPRNSAYFGWGMLVFLSGLGSAFGVIFIICSTDEFGYNGYSQGYNSMCIAYLGVMLFVFLIPNEVFSISEFLREYLTVHNPKKLKRSKHNGKGKRNQHAESHEGKSSRGDESDERGEFHTVEELLAAAESDNVDEPLDLDCLAEIPELNLEESIRGSDLNYLSQCRVCQNIGSFPECGCVP